MSNLFILQLNSYGYLDIIGDDSDRFLQGQITININTPTEKEAFLAALCNPKGRIVSLFHICKIKNGYRLFMPTNIIDGTASHLAKYAVFFKTVTINATSSTPLNVINGCTESILEKLTKNQLVSKHIKLSKTALSILLPSLNGDNDHNAQAPSIDTIADCLGLKCVSDNNWYCQLAKNGIPWLSESTIEHFLPHNLNLPDLQAIDFKKGCFTGQEVIARMQYKGKLKQHMRLLNCKQPLTPAALKKLFQKEKEVGTLICQTTDANQESLVLALVKDISNKDASFQLNIENTPILKLAE